MIAEDCLRIENLVVEFVNRESSHRVCNDISLRVPKGQTLALVGESGCGKSVSMRAVMGLLPRAAKVTSGRALLAEIDLLQLPLRELNRTRGKRIAMIFQEPMSALNPTLRIGTQIGEVLRVHHGLSKRAAAQRCISLLEEVSLTEPAYRCRQYPFEMSGGMLQRVMIAMALAGEPELLIADEPTTALDTTVQAQILDLLRNIQRQRGMSIVLITHDLGVVARMADQVAVMYAGDIVESATVDNLFSTPLHPYTQGLLAATPRLHSAEQDYLQAIAGAPPDLRQQRTGCSFAPRCQHRMQICQQRAAPQLAANAQHSTRCWRYHQDNPNAVEKLEAV